MFNLSLATQFFKCEVTAPGLIQQFNVPIPESAVLSDEATIDPSNYPSSYTTALHEHDLVLKNNLYGGMGFACDKCTSYGKTYAYHCDTCQYDLHPQCALEEVQ